MMAAAPKTLQDVSTCKKVLRSKQLPRNVRDVTAPDLLSAPSSCSCSSFGGAPMTVVYCRCQAATRRADELPISVSSPNSTMEHSLSLQPRACDEPGTERHLLAAVEETPELLERRESPSVNVFPAPPPCKKEAHLARRHTNRGCAASAGVSCRSAEPFLMMASARMVDTFLTTSLNELLLHCRQTRLRTIPAYALAPSTVVQARTI